MVRPLAAGLSPEIERRWDRWSKDFDSAPLALPLSGVRLASAALFLLVWRCDVLGAGAG